MFKNPFSFEGRIRRTEYGLSLLIYFGALLGMGLLAEGLDENDENFTTFSLIFLVLFIPTIWFLLAQSAKRCHDKNLSGWFQIIPLFRYVLVFLPSDYGPNRFGPNPKGEGNPDDLADFGKELVGT